MYAFLKLSDPHASELTTRGEIAWKSLTERVKADTAQAIERILKSVGKEHVPHDLDKQALCSDIADAYCARHLAFDLFGGSKSRQRLEALRRISKATERPVALLEADIEMDAMIGSALKRAGIHMPAYPMSRPLTVAAFLKQLCRGIAEIEKMQQGIEKKWRRGHKHDPSLRGRRVTEKEWLAGVSLPLVFEWHFRKRAGRSRSMGQPSGPMVRFIGAVMEELGLRYSDEAIMRAISLRAPLRAQQRKGKALPLILRQI
jgi:hypothetical protein